MNTSVLKQVATQFGTPTYVYFADSIRAQTRLLANTLPRRFSLFYAVKANSHPALLKILLREGTGFEIASLGELETVLSIGAPANKIIYTGPGKKDSELTAAIRKGIKCLHAESFGELQRINAIAKKLKKIMAVAIRINPVHSAKVTQAMGGVSRQFGIDEEQLAPSKLKELQKLRNVKVIGIHVHAGCGLGNQHDYLENAENIFKIAKKLSPYIDIRYIDIGGGIAIPYAENGAEFSTVGLKAKFEKLVHKYSLENCEIILEPGRFLVGPSGVFLARVVDTKTSRGVNYTILDGGINVLLRPSLIGTNHPTFNLTKRSKKECILAGPLCTPVDTLGKLHVDAKQGDIIAITQAGAHCLSAAMPLYLSHGTAAEILIENKKLRKISRRLTGYELASLLH